MSRDCSQIVLLLSLTLASGCSLLPSAEKPNLQMPQQTLQPSPDPFAIQRMQSANSQNAVSVYLEGSKGPKLVPLPPPGQTVLLSGLCDQTQVLESLGKTEIVVWRDTPEAPSGAKLAVRFKRSGRIDPLTDYALKPGDRIIIRPMENDWISSLFKRL